MELTDQLCNIEGQNRWASSPPIGCRVLHRAGETTDDSRRASDQHPIAASAAQPQTLTEVTYISA
jgi:hypothetical protein